MHIDARIIYSFHVVKQPLTNVSQFATHSLQKFNALERGKAKKKLSQHEYESQLQVLGMQSASFRRLEDAAHMIKNKFVLQLQTVEAEMEEEAYWDGFYRAPHTSGSTAEIEHMMRSTRFTAPTTAATSTSTSTSASKLKSTSKSQESGSGSGLSSRERARERGRRERERETERGSGEARDSSSVMYEADDEKKPRRRRHKK